MPSETERQRRFMGAELGRKHHGEKIETKMSESQLRDFAKKPIKKGSKARAKKRQQRR